MTRPRQFRHNIWLKVNQVERALVAYYAAKHKKDQTAVIRGMIRLVARIDENFDADEFKKFVEKELAPQESDERVRAELRQLTDEFLATQSRSEKPAKGTRTRKT